MEVNTTSIEQTAKVARELALAIKPLDVLALYGELGAGKTTFVRYLVESLGSTSRVQSPTFVIARKYFANSGSIKTIYHLDLYRLKSGEELKDLDLNHFLTDPSGVTIIEWPELAEEFLPKNFIKIKFENTGEDTRKIYVENLY